MDDNFFKSKFNWKTYVNKYQDLQKAGIDNEEKAWSHAKTHGRKKKENRDVFNGDKELLRYFRNCCINSIVKPIPEKYHNNIINIIKIHGGLGDIIKQYNLITSHINKNEIVICITSVAFDLKQTVNSLFSQYKNKILFLIAENRNIDQLINNLHFESIYIPNTSEFEFKNDIIYNNCLTDEKTNIKILINKKEFITNKINYRFSIRKDYDFMRDEPLYYQTIPITKLYDKKCSEDFYNKVVNKIGKDYILIHSRPKDNSSRDLLPINEEYFSNKDLPIYNFDFDSELNYGIKSNNILDYYDIVKNAKEIHTYDGSLSNFINYMDVELENLHFHMYCRDKDEKIDYLNYHKQNIRSGKWHIKTWNYYEDEKMDQLEIFIKRYNLYEKEAIIISGGNSNLDLNKYLDNKDIFFIVIKDQIKQFFDLGLENSFQILHISNDVNIYKNLKKNKNILYIYYSNLENNDDVYDLKFVNKNKFNNRYKLNYFTNSNNIQLNNIHSNALNKKNVFDYNIFIKNRNILWGDIIFEMAIPIAIKCMENKTNKMNNIYLHGVNYTYIRILEDINVIFEKLCNYINTYKKITNYNEIFNTLQNFIKISDYFIDNNCVDISKEKEQEYIKILIILEKFILDNFIYHFNNGISDIKKYKKIDDDAIKYLEAFNQQVFCNRYYYDKIIKKANKNLFEIIKSQYNINIYKIDTGLKSMLINCPNYNIENQQEKNLRLCKELKNKYINKDCLILSGTSDNDIKPFLKYVNNGNIVIISVKSTIQYLTELDIVPNFHCSNFCNEINYSFDKNTIGVYTMYSNPITKDLDSIQKNDYSIVLKNTYDIKDNIPLDIINDKNINTLENIIKNDSIHKWGDIFYEQCLPIALHIGCKNIYISGISYNYDNKETNTRVINNKKTIIENRKEHGHRNERDILIIEATTKLNKFIKKYYNANIYNLNLKPTPCFPLEKSSLSNLIKKEVNIIQFQEIHLETMPGIIEYFKSHLININLYVTDKKHVGWVSFLQKKYDINVKKMLTYEHLDDLLIEEKFSIFKNTNLITIFNSGCDLSYIKQGYIDSKLADKMNIFIEKITKNLKYYIVVHNSENYEHLSKLYNTNYLTISDRLYNYDKLNLTTINSYGKCNSNNKEIKKCVNIAIIGKFRDNNRDMNAIEYILNNYSNIYIYIYCRSNRIDQNIIELNKKYDKLILHIDKETEYVYNALNNNIHFIRPALNFENKKAEYYKTSFSGCYQDAINNEIPLIVDEETNNDYKFYSKQYNFIYKKSLKETIETISKISNNEYRVLVEEVKEFYTKKSNENIAKFKLLI